MLDAPEFRDWTFVWAFREPEAYSFLEADERTHVVRIDSDECIRWLHAAKYWILNSRAFDWWVPGPDQVYVQCWHGTPLKRLGYDLEGTENAMNTQEDIRYKYRSDAERFTYLLSPCAFSTEKFTSAWDLRASGREDAVLELGYPRDDALAAPGPDAVSKAKERLGLSGEKRKLILYAPTWRDDQYDADVGYTYDINMDFSTLREELGDSYAILYRAHYLVHDDLDTGAFAGFVYDVSDADDINDIYLVSDMLITDYSSVFFDYAILRRPIIFYMYDLEKYESMLRGFYLGLDELPRTRRDIGQRARSVHQESGGKLGA
jgi:CDP-glycerol glycerophosphotransferase